MRFMPGMPRLDLSVDIANVRLERLPCTRYCTTSAPDDFFDAVRRVLAENGVTDDWTFTGPEAPYIEMTIEFGETRVRLISWHTILERDSKVVATERGIESLDGRDRSKVLSQQSERFQRHRRAFEQILALVSERLSAKFRGL